MLFLNFFVVVVASDILSADRQLAKEIEFDLRKFEEEQEEIKRLQDQQNTVQSLQVATGHWPSCNHPSLNGCHVKIGYQMVVRPECKGVIEIRTFIVRYM